MPCLYWKSPDHNDAVVPESLHGVCNIYIRTLLTRRHTYLGIIKFPFSTYFTPSPPFTLSKISSLISTVPHFYIVHILVHILVHPVHVYIYIYIYYIDFIVFHLYLVHSFNPFIRILVLISNATSLQLMDDVGFVDQSWSKRPGGIGKWPLSINQWQHVSLVDGPLFRHMLVSSYNVKHGSDNSHVFVKLGWFIHVSVKLQGFFAMQFQLKLCFNTWIYFTKDAKFKLKIILLFTLWWFIGWKHFHSISRENDWWPLVWDTQPGSNVSPYLFMF